MANTTQIDELVAPEAVEQFVQLKTEGKALREELVTLLETAIKLNATLGGSTPTNFTKNLKAATDATNQLIQADQKVTDNKVKQEQKQEEIINKYLIQLAKQGRAIEAEYNKQIALEEKKAAKIAAIQAESARKAAVQFPPEPQTSNPSLMEPTGQGDDIVATRYEPIITGQEEMAISATKSAEALQGESASIAEQADVLAGLSTEYRANVELLLELQAARAANATELKELTVQDAASGERAVFLTAEQIRLKLAISEVNTELNRQTKEMLSADGSIKALDQSVLLLSQAYEQLSVAERESEQGQKMGAELAALRTQQNELGLAVKNTKNNIGNYTESVNKSTVGIQLADRITNQFMRSIIRMGVQFLLMGVAFKAIEWLWDYIKGLDMFNHIATETEARLDGLSKAFDSVDYKKAVENIDELGLKLDLAKRGLIDSDSAINEYNETIGKTAGYVNNLTDAQKGYIDNAAIYIDMVQKQTAAQIILGESADAIAQNEKRKQELRQGILESQNKLAAYKATGADNPSIEEAEYQLTEDIKNNQQEIIDNDKRLKEQLSGSNSAAESLLQQKNADSLKLGGKSTGTDAVADERNKNANATLEHQKILSQALMNNEKLSYETRLNSTRDYFAASEQIEKNNTQNQIDRLPKKDARIEQITKEANNKQLELTQQEHTAIQALRDKQYKQDQQILKNNLEKERDLFKSVLDDPNIYYDSKLVALAAYNERSKQLIDADYAEQKKEAGKNKESLTIAEQDKDKAILQLENDTAAKRLEIQKKNIADIIAAAKESEQNHLEIIDNGAKLSLRGLTEAKDKKINILNQQRAENKIDEKKYNQELLDINDQYNIDRLAQEIATQQAILAVREGIQGATASRMKVEGSSQLDIDKFVKGSNSGIQSTKDKIADLTDDLLNAKAKKQTTKNTTKEADKERKELEDAGLKATVDAIDLVDSLRQKTYENEMIRLENQGKMIEENASISKAAIERSMDTQQNKARREQELDAQVASQKENLQRKENELKRKEAKANKEATIAKLIAEGALAVITALTAPPGVGQILAAITAGEVAIQLAKAIATPLPAYAKGGTTPGGPVWVGERGVEHARLPSGEQFYTPGIATIMNLPKGTVITPNHMLPDTPKWTSTRSDNSDVVSGLNRVEKAVIGQKTSRARLSGWVEAQRQADAWNDYSRRYFR